MLSSKNKKELISSLHILSIIVIYSSINFIKADTSQFMDKHVFIFTVAIEIEIGGG